MKVGGGLAISETKTAVKSAPWVLLSRVISLSHSMPCGSLLPTELSELESFLSNTVAASPR